MNHPEAEEDEQQEHGEDDEDSHESDGDDDHGTMTTLSRHYFGYSAANDDSNDDGDAQIEEGAFFLDIIENIQEDYALFIWPCSIVLAEYVWQQRARFSGKSVVEIGAGTSLPGLVAAKVGADVILTDRSDAKVLDSMRRTAEMNTVHCKILGLDWGEWDDYLFDMAPEIVLGADVFYDTKDFEDLFASVSFLLQKTPHSVFMTTYDNRSGHHLMEYLMVKWGWKCTKLLNAFTFMPSSKSIKLQGNIQLAEIMWDTEQRF